MSVRLASRKRKYIDLDGEYDPVVATENEAEFLLKCEECGKTAEGTSFELADLNWEWEISIDTKAVEIKDSEAICANCNEDAEVPSQKEEEELSPAEKAEQDPSQRNLGELL